MIILPDKWTLPSNCNFTAGFQAGNNSYVTTGENNLWADMEANGAVFLPAAGSRLGAAVSSVGSNCGYWSSTTSGASGAYRVYFYSDRMGLALYDHAYGFSVRLVRCLKKKTNRNNRAEDKNIQEKTFT